MKKYFILSLMLFLFTAISAQSENKDVTITTTGSGPTLEIAKQNALRSAIEQTYGAFISTKTEIFNDEVVADEMASVSSGNIKSFEILNETKFPDSSWVITLKSEVSIGNLTSFVNAKGVNVEIKGGIFANQIKIFALNEKSEELIIYNLIRSIHSQLEKSFDFSIDVKNPVSINGSNENWKLPLSVNVKANQNISFCENYLVDIIEKASLTESDVINYKELNKNIFKLQILHASIVKTFYLRNLRSLFLIKALCDNWFYYITKFKISVPNISAEELKIIKFSGGTNSIDKWNWLFKNIKQKSEYEYGPAYRIDEIIGLEFPQIETLVAVFNYELTLPLNIIEKISNFNVEPKNNSIDINYGGYVIPINNDYSIVWSLYNQFSKKNSDGQLETSYSDWGLPSTLELDLIRKYFENNAKEFIRRFRFDYHDLDLSYALRRINHDGTPINTKKIADKINQEKETSELEKYYKYRKDNPDEQNKLFILNVIESDGKLFIPIQINNSDTINFLVGDDVEGASISNEIVSNLLARKVIRKRDIRNNEVVHFDYFKFLDLPVGAPNEIPLGQDTKLQLTNSEFSILKYYKNEKVVVLTTEKIAKMIKMFYQEK